MGAFAAAFPLPSFTGPSGDLLLVRVDSGAADLEEVLDRLARLSFPVNAECRHGAWSTAIEFPAYRDNLEEVRLALPEGAHLESARRMAECVALK